MTNINTVKRITDENRGIKNRIIGRSLKKVRKRRK